MVKNPPRIYEEGNGQIRVDNPQSPLEGTVPYNNPEALDPATSGQHADLYQKAKASDDPARVISDFLAIENSATIRERDNQIRKDMLRARYPDSA